MAHNGPAGLGGQPHSICGVDWLPAAGDHGDPDLQAVLQQLHEAGRDVALVLHGHMHHMIKGESQGGTGMSACAQAAVAVQGRRNPVRMSHMPCSTPTAFTQSSKTKSNAAGIKPPQLDKCRFGSTTLCTPVLSTG